MKRWALLGIVILLGILTVPFARAQNTQADPIQFAPVGQGTVAPSVYGENNVFIPAPIIPPPANPTPSSYTPPPAQPTPQVSTGPVPETKNILSNFLSNKLKIDLHGAGKSCMAGTSRPVPWTLVNGGVDVDTKEELLVVLNQALGADARIRRITVNQNQIEIDYLQPARLFKVIPINYLFKIKTDVSTMATIIDSPRWLSFATTYHAQVTQTLMDGLSRIYTPSTVDYLLKQNLFYKHAFATAATTAVMTPIDLHPFADTFWICVVVPFFVVFLLLFGLLFGFILYWFAKRRRERYVRRVRDEYDDHDHGAHVTRKAPPHVRSLREHDDESLDDYIQSKRFK